MIEWDLPLRLAHKASYLMAMQELSGVCFDVEAGQALAQRIREEMQSIRQEIEPQLPTRQLNKTEAKEYCFPAKPWKADGSWSHHMQRFAERHGLKQVEGGVEYEGKVVPIVAGSQLPKEVPITLDDESTPLKDYFLSQGWEPTFFNQKKDEKGFKVNTSPKFADKGKLCPNLEVMQGEIVKPIVKYLSLGNRLGVLAGKDGDKGWLNHPRLAYDGRLPAGSSGITPTFRQKHTTVCNVPKNKPDVLLGKEFRSLFIAAPGKVLVGWDASSLEDRVKGHWTFKYDGGAYATKILDPEFDVHQENADTWGLTRQEAKGGTYALAYNCGVATLAKTLKCSNAQAAKYHEAYWRVNKPVKDLEEALLRYWEYEGNKQYIVGLDRRKVHIRKKSALVNTLIQSSASILMDYAAAWIDAKLGGIVFDKDFNPCYNYKGYTARRVLFMHDEYVFECDPEIADDIARLGEESIRAAGRYYKLKVPLESQAQIGKSWAELK